MSLCISDYCCPCQCTFKGTIAVWVLVDMNVGTVASQTTVIDVQYYFGPLLRM